MKMKKRLLSILLSLVLMLGLLPGMGLTALAWDGNPYVDLVPTGSEADDLTAKQVTFNGKKWYVIKDESTAKNAGTLTLLYAGSLGNYQFDKNGSNVYANSSIKTALGNLTAENGYYFPVAEAIKDTGNGKLYLLSEEEANQVPLNVRADFPSGAWWLCTTRSESNVAYVFVAATDTPGRIPTSGVAPTTSGVGVRPALQLDLSKVVFDSETKTFAIPATAPTDVTVTGATLIAGYGAGSVKVTATAADGHTLSYQWYQNTTNSNEGGSLIEGANSATYDIPAGKTAGNYYYYCVVTATRTDNSQTASATSGVATVTVAADTDALVAKLAEEKSIDLNSYYLIPAEDMYFTSKEYWNKNSSWEKLPDEGGEEHVATKQFTIQGLPEESVIFCKAYYAFEAVAWESSSSDTGKSETIGKNYNLLTKISDQFDWWDTYSLFGFNLTKYAEGDFNTKEVADLSSIKDAFRIYVPKPANAAEVRGTGYPTVADAIRAAGAGGTVKLLRNVTENVVLTSGQNITLNLNGYTLTNDGRHCTIVAQNGSTLVVTGNGTVDNTTHGCAPLYNNGGTVTLNGGTFRRSAEAGEGGNTYYTVVNRGTMTINEGVTVDNDSYHYSSLIANGYYGLTQNGYREIDPKVSNGYVPGESAEKPTLTINGGTFTGGNQALKNDVNGVATITGGSFSSNAGNAIKNLSELTISGGTFTATAEGKFALESVSGSATVTGGTFNGKLRKDEGATIAISGGEFSEIVPEDFCAEGYQPATTKNSNDKYIVALPSVVEEAPAPKTLTYTGQAQELVTAGTATGGEMQYALGTENAATEEYTTSIPKGTDAGTYYVWYKVEGDGNHNDTDPVCVTVTIADRTYSVTFDPNGGTGAPAAQTKVEGQNLTLPTEIPNRYNNGAYVVTYEPNGGTMTGKVTYAQHRTYFRFLNWNTAKDGSGTSYAPGAVYTAEEAVTLYAQWVKNGEATASIPLPTPKLEGHVFQGWATNTDLESGMTGRYKPTADITLYATWTIGTYTISFDTDGGSEIEPITGEYGTEITAVPEAPIKPGYVFKGWDKAIPETMPGEDLVIKAIYEVQPFGEADVTLPEYLSEIEEEAFEGAAMKSVYVPDSVETIGANAFGNCAQLEKLRLPQSCAIDETAFTGCKALAIYAPAGGTVEEFCETQGISFVPETAE